MRERIPSEAAKKVVPGPGKMLAPKRPPRPDWEDYWATRVAEKARGKVLGFFAIGTAAVSLIITLYGITSIKSLLENQLTNSIETERRDVFNKIDEKMKEFDSYLESRKATADVRIEAILTGILPPTTGTTSGRYELIDLRPLVGPIQNQGQTTSTVGYSLAYAITAELRGAKQNSASISGWGIYKSSLPTGAADMQGTTFLAALKALRTIGAYSVEDWPFGKDAASKDAKVIARVKSWSVLDITKLDEILRYLRSGHVVVAAIEITQEFFNPGKDGNIVVPQEIKPLGGHGIVISGYDSYTKQFLFANTWGPSWGDNGFGRIRDADLIRIIGEAYVLQL